MTLLCSKTDQFVNLKKYYSGNQLSLLLIKGVYPYDYIDCRKKVDETSFLAKEAFYSKVMGEGITDEDYQHAQQFGRNYNIESVKDCRNLYSLSDVLLLADVFKTLGTFARIIMDWIRLDISVRHVLPGMLL